MLGVPALPFEVAQEVRVVVGAERRGRGTGRTPRARRTDRAAPTATAAGQAATLDHPDGDVRREREERDDQEELQHTSNVGRGPTAPTLEVVKEFVVYTALRIALFLGSLALVFGIWWLVAGEVLVLWAVVIAFVLSGLGSLWLLNGPREAFAMRVQERAARASKAFEEMKAKEDVD